jgi:peptidoglycan/xylan/chitin deacetylase (PgdA/CDA1 family)
LSGEELFFCQLYCNIYIIRVTNNDSLDWKGISADQITKRVLPRVKSGSIVLFHNAALHTPEALPGIIESLQKQGYNIVPISQLIYKDNYTIDVAGKQHSTLQTSSMSIANES